jgi:hypothetical protein
MTAPKSLFAPAIALALAAGGPAAADACDDALESVSGWDAAERADDTPSARVDQYIVVAGVHVAEGGGTTMKTAGTGPVENWFGDPPRSVRGAAKTEAERLKAAGDAEGCARVIRNAKAWEAAE